MSSDNIELLALDNQFRKTLV